MKNNGFTLIELLVVIAILGVLSSLVLVAINPEQRLAAARDAQRIADLRQISNALEAYYTKHGEYPKNCYWSGSNSCDSVNRGANWIPGIVEEGYLKTLPTDPINTVFVSATSANQRAYFYTSRNVSSWGMTNGQDYILGTWMEANNSPFTISTLSPNPMQPDCSGSIGFNSSVGMIRSFSCAGDDPNAL